MDECHFVDWPLIIEITETQRALIEPLENFTEDGFIMPCMSEAIIDSWHSTIH